MEAEADGVCGVAGGGDGGLGGEDLRFVVAGELRVGYHVARRDLAAEFLINGRGGGFAVWGAADMPGGGFLEEEAVGAFILEEDDGGQNFRGEERLELAFRFRLNVSDHVGVGEGFELGGDLKALIYGEYKAHAEGSGALGRLDLDVKAAPVEGEEEFFAAGGGVVVEFSGAKTLTALAFNSDDVDAGIGEGFDGVFDGSAVEVVECAARDGFHT